jgi:hypothetical protein
MRALGLSAALWCLTLTGAQAQDICAAVVNGEALRFDRETFMEGRAAPSRRERLLSWPGQTWDGLRGRDPECDSATVITYLSQTIPADDIDGYCLTEAGGYGLLLIPGPRNFRGRCSTSTCELVNATTDAALGTAKTITSRAADAALGDGDRTTAILHASGAAIVSGQASAIAATLGQVGTAVGTALAAPGVLAATAVSVVAVGGVVYVCRD